MRSAHTGQRATFRACVGTINGMDRPDSQPTSPLEILRRLENLLRLGTVAEVDHDAARCRVRTGNLTTNWGPWLSLRAGGPNGRQWWAPVVGEQCLLLSPGGDLANAVTLCGIASDPMPAGSASPTECRTDWSATDHFTHDRAGGDLVIECARSITLRVGATVLRLTPDGATITPDLVAADRVSLVQHVHTEVLKGQDNTGAPL